MYQPVAQDLRKKWDEEQEEIVRQNYDGNGSKLAKVLPFSASAIRNKAKRLGKFNSYHFHNVVKTELPKLSDFDIGYVAAFLDGEGSITHSSSASTKPQYRVKFANSNSEVILWIQQILTIGKVRVHQPRKSQHLASFDLTIERQGDVWAFLEFIIPYLKVKQNKAIHVLSELKGKYEVCSISTGY